MSVTPELVKMTAARQLKVLKNYPGLMPWIMAHGLSEADAKAVAYNAALVFYATGGGDGEIRSPFGVLEAYSLEEIARICGLIENLGEADYR